MPYLDKALMAQKEAFSWYQFRDTVVAQGDGELIWTHDITHYLQGLVLDGTATLHRFTAPNGRTAEWLQWGELRDR